VPLPLEDRSPVLALSVLDAATMPGGLLGHGSQLLVVVRDRDANPTHPNVVSVPTQRLPASLYRDLIASASEAGDDPDRPVSYFEGGVVDSRVDSGHHPVIYAVESMLSRKLGLAEPLERGEVAFRAALRAVVTGVAFYDGDGEQQPTHESIDMLSVVVELLDGRRRLPIRTGSYSMMAWTEVDRFIAGVRSRDASTLSSAFDPIELCVHGVCLTAAEVTMARLVGLRPLDESPAGERHTELRA
jgi:hypothetical protein